MILWQHLMQGGNEQIFTWVIILGAMALVFYFLMWRPQKRERQRRQQMMEMLRKNDRVVTMGGIHGTVVAVKDNVIILKIDENSDVKIRINRSSVGAVIPQDAEEEDTGTRE